MSLKRRLLASAVVFAAFGGATQALAQQEVPGQASTPAAQGDAPAAATTTVSEVVVTAQRLNAARATIEPALGATTYTVTNATIQALPGGDNQQLNQILLQLPGVVQDSYGQLHVRDDHNNLQYRINGVILPDGIAVFGQTLSPRLIEKLDLITGALPAQYGLRTAGIVDITTKSGLFNNGGQVSLYGGGHGEYEPSFEYGGSSGNTNFFVSADFRRNQLGIESVDGRSTPDHDRTDQGQIFAYLDHILSPNDRVSLVGGYSDQRFQIPDPTGLNAAVDGGGFTLNGRTDYPSELLNERQRERTGFTQLSFLHDAGPLTLQASVFARFSQLIYSPDETGELLFNGQAQRALKEDTAGGLQLEGAWRANDTNTVRFGFIFSNERGRSRTTTQVFPTDADGNQLGDTPETLSDRSGQTQNEYSVYLQDEWRILPSLTINYGARYDRYDAYRSEDQWSPRINAVWTPFEGTTAHVGYARFFNPPPFELVGTETVSLFQGTTGASTLTQDTTPLAEKQNYYDVGVLQRIAQVPGLSVGVDAYYRQSVDLIDEGQFGAPIILTPFNYAKGRIRGVEFNANYTHGPWLAYANAAYTRGQGENIVSSQFSFSPDDLAFIRNHFIFLDHDQTYTASAGVSYTFRDGPLRGLKPGVDMVFGSGLRADGLEPNGDSVPSYVQVNTALSYDFSLPYTGRMQVRLDVINIFDEKYEIRDGTGVGVGAPQFGPRRGVFGGVTKYF